MESEGNKDKVQSHNSYINYEYRKEQPRKQKQ